MDEHDCDADKLRRTYQQFPIVNRAFSGWARIYRRFLRPNLTSHSTTSLLDLGCGGGDVALYLDSLAKRDGLLLRITGVDPDLRAMDFAMSHPARPGVTFRGVAGGVLVEEGHRFDVVISNHVLHHLGGSEFQDFLAESQQLSTRLVLHNDLRRHPVAYSFFSLAAMPLRGSFIREDGLTSIRRSYTRDELAAELSPAWDIVPLAPFRNLLINSKSY